MFNFLKYKNIFFLISAIVIGVGLFSIVKWGYTYSIEFVGGTNIQYKLNKKVDVKAVRQIFENDKIEIVDLTINNNILNARTRVIDENKEASLKSDFEKKLNVKIDVLQSQTVGPTLGKELIRKTLIAAVLAIIGILLYMSFAFKNFNFAVAAIIALFHDVLVVIGVYSLLSHFLGAQIDTLFVTAILTTMSFSVHDTIVIFDKIREYFRIGEGGNIEYDANKALTQTLVRSTNNSMTIIFMLLALTLLGGQVIRFFAATLLIGTITGTYSSPFIATPVLVWLEKRKNKK